MGLQTTSAPEEAALGSTYLKVFRGLPAKDESTTYGDCRWNSRDKYVWFFTLLAGTSACYACRTTFPLVAPMASQDQRWSKTETGTVLSSFFWGYILTQILGGYLSDRFGAEKVLLGSGLGWSLITVWFPYLMWAISDHDASLCFVVFVRICFGALQGVHFPSLASITTQRLGIEERSFFFSITTAGAAMGALFTGIIGSNLLDYVGWPHVFYTIGFIALLWVVFLRFCAIERERRRHLITVSTDKPLLIRAHDVKERPCRVPWLFYLKSPALWACTFCHFCQNNCFFILVSWLPTYFQEVFPGTKRWLFNVVPWCMQIPGIFVATWVSRKLMANKFSVSQSRKIAQTICMATEAVCLVFVGRTKTFPYALCLMSICLLGGSFHSVGVLTNPQDVAPKHTGSVFGIMNTIGCVPGFIGVYLVGYILETTGSWTAIFDATAAVNVVGLTVFLFFGNGTPIV